MVDGVLPIEHSSSSLRTATRKITGGDTGKLDKIPARILNTCSPIGWKWAQRDDAKWMMDDFVKNDEKNGTMFGLTKEQLQELTEG